MDPLFIHNIDPILYRFGPFAIGYYGLLFGSAVVMTLFFLRYLFRARNYNVDLARDYLIYALVGLLIGARIVEIAFYNPGFYFSHPIEIVKIWKGGIASHGGTVGAIVGTFLFVRRNDLTFYQVTDLLVIPASLGTLFIRLGNFLNSEIVGRVTDVPWAVVFKRYYNTFQTPAEQMLPRHPTQLYEMVNGLIVFGILFFLFKKKGDELPDGVLFYTFFVAYFSLRFIVEFFKEYQTLSQSQSFLTMGQYLSIPFILIGVFMLIRRSRTSASQ
jgi:phosphatidylglycerol:prolipoprotein diacylglycerol transferase